MRLVFNCIFWYLLVIVHDQSGIKCGVSSQRKFAIFLAHSAESGFHNKKCCILTFPKKVQYFSVLRQNKNYESPKMLKVHYVECPIMLKVHYVECPIMLNVHYVECPICWVSIMCKGLDIVWESATPPIHIWEKSPQKKRFYFWGLPLDVIMCQFVFSPTPTC